MIRMRQCLRWFPKGLAVCSGFPCFGIYLQGGYTAVPGTVNQVMLTVVVYQVARVDGVPLVVTVGPVVGFDVEVQFFVRGVGDNIALIFPAVVVGGV